MKQIFFTFTITCFFLFSTKAQVVAGQIDDFEDGTTQGWVEGTSSPNPPINISTGGPLGANDNFLQNISSGTGTAGSKMAFFNDTQWTGNFTIQEVVAIKFDAKVETNDLNLRVAFDGAGGQFATTNAISLTQGSGWNSVSIPILAGDFTATGGFDINQTLQNVSRMKFLSSSTPSWVGDRIAATIELDNIEAESTLSIKDKSLTDFLILPNPANKNITLKLPINENYNIEIYNVLGNRIYFFKTNTVNNRINVQNWAKGVYIIRVSSTRNSHTKRFIKR